MAVWQFTVEFIPRKNLVQKFGEIPKAIDDEILWSENLDEEIILPVNFEEQLISLGKKENLTWIENSLNWGNYDNGTHITIILRGKSKASVFARFHAAELDENFVKVVLNFAVVCNCVLLTNNETIIEPEMDKFFREFKNSNSYRFCENPKDYLQSDEVKRLNENIRKKLSSDEFNFNR